MSEAAESTERSIGRYAICGEIAAGGMATVHVGRLLGSVGFSRIVAIKALHPQFAKDPDFLSMFLDEARLAGRIRHPNVVSVLDVVSRNGQIYLIMDYVQGESLSRLVRHTRTRDAGIPLPIALAIMVGTLEGLHAAHEARDASGNPLGIVHRDVSPQNIMVGVDGSARILDFGVAKAVGRMQTTRSDQLKGKLAYMAPEQLAREPLDRGVDIYAASIVLWELLTGSRLFQGEDEVQTFKLALHAHAPPPSGVRPGLSAELDALVLKGLARERSARYESARDMARAIEATCPLATPREVGEWVEQIAAEALHARAEAIADIERAPNGQSSAPIDPLQARDDESLLRKIERNGIADVVTEILGQAPPIEVRASTIRPQLGSSLRRRRRWQLGTAVGLVVFLTGLLVWTRGDRAEPRTSHEAILTPLVTVATAPSPNPNESSAAAMVNVASPTPPAASFASVRPSPQHPVLPASHARKVATSNDKTKTDCSNPFTIDEHGLRIPKRQCL